MDVLEATAELERFKIEISLAEVAYAYDYELDRKESSRASFVMRRLADNDKIVIGNEGGHDVFFSVRNEQQNGSVIDFVMQQEGINLGRSRQMLRKWLDTLPLSSPVKVVASMATRSRSQYRRTAPRFMPGG